MTPLKHHSKAEFGTVNALYMMPQMKFSNSYLQNDRPLAVFQLFLNKIVT